jgi:RND family efflux transporter MFP subunit
VESALKAFKLSEEMLKNGAVSQEEYNAKKYQLDTSDLQLDAAKIKLDNTEIKSPIDGIVTGRHIHVGDTVRSTQAVFSVGDFEPLFARIHVPEKEIERIRIGQEARVSVESASDQEFKGVVKMISPIVDAQTGTIKITIQIDEGRGILKPGMFATVYIATQTHPSALVISKKALVLEREEEVVFTVEEGVARRVPVKTGFDDSNRVEILSGLKEGDRVITVGQDGLRDGASVRAVGEVAVAERAAPEVRGAGGDRPSGPPAGGRPDSPAGGRQVSESRQPSEGGGQGGFRAGSSGGGFNLSQLPPDRRKALEERMLGNPQIKDEYEKKLKEDPGLATDPEKRAKFFGEMMARFRGGQ